MPNEEVRRRVRIWVRARLIYANPNRKPNPKPNPNPTPTQLTALGFHLATLPVDVRIGKLILLGAVLGLA